MRDAIQLCIDELRQKGVECHINVKMADLTTLKIGGEIDLFVKIKSEWESVIVQGVCNKFDVPWQIIGRGSNILASDKGIRGILVQFDDYYNKIERNNDFVTVCGNVKMSSLINFAFRNNLGGVEEFVGIPSSVLGLVKMNGGAFGKELGELVEFVSVQKDGETKTISRAFCNFEYRHSRFFESAEILNEVTLRLYQDSQKEIKVKMQTYINARKNTQPIFEKTAGSVFKNPTGTYAGKLLETVGLKGFALNGVRFSNKHANFIENFASGNCDDVLKLIDIGREKVYNNFNIQLETEIQFME